MKTALLKGGATVIICVLVGFTTTAQNVWKQFLAEGSLGNTTVLLAGNTEKNIPATSFSVRVNYSEKRTPARTVEYESDHPLALEPWMFETGHFRNRTVYVAAETDELLELEDWMSNSKYFQPVSAVTAEKDRRLKLEKWMMDSKFWQM